MKSTRERKRENVKQRWRGIYIQREREREREREGPYGPVCPLDFRGRSKWTDRMIIWEQLGSW